MRLADNPFSAAAGAGILARPVVAPGVALACSTSASIQLSRAPSSCKDRNRIVRIILSIWISGWRVSRSSARLRSANDFTSDRSALPPEIGKLFPREQQIAEIVYDNGLVTAKDVELHLSQSLTNSAIRSFLNRLVRKGLLLQQRCGRHGTILYAPALTDPFAREMAIKQFAADFYDGSLELIADELGDLFARQPTLAQLLESYERAPPLQVRELSSRMRQIADIVYRSGGCTSRDIQAALDIPLTRSCIKTLLGRMAVRGIIKTRPSGRHREFAYLPALITRQVRRLALKRLVENRFADSAGSALQTTLQLMHAQTER